MADKKEVIDYLRNRQKRAEIEAKVNGINIWVLLGAIAIVSWQLIESLESGLWANRDIAARVLLCAQAAYFLVFISGRDSVIREDIRFSSVGPRSEAPLLGLLNGLTLLLPAGVFLAVIGQDLDVLIVGLFGLAFTLSCAADIVYSLIGQKPARFPAPRFGLTLRASVVMGLVFFFSFSAVIFDQAMTLWVQASRLSIGLLKSLALLVALFLLVVTVLRRKYQNHGIDWTYELETDLLLDDVSPDVALRRIEHRALGPRLQDVMNRFFDDLDARYIELKASISSCRDQLAAVHEIPIEYPVERRDRVIRATELPMSQIDALISDCKACAQYISKLLKDPWSARRPGMASQLRSLNARIAAYVEKIEAAGKELDELIPKVAKGP